MPAGLHAKPRPVEDLVQLHYGGYDSVPKPPSRAPGQNVTCDTWRRQVSQHPAHRLDRRSNPRHRTRHGRHALTTRMQAVGAGSRPRGPSVTARLGALLGSVRHGDGNTSHWSVASG